jgi:hypothetical protein
MAMCWEEFMKELKGVKFETFEDLAKLLTPLIAKLVRTKGLIPPLDLTLVDSLNHLVVSVEVNAQGVFRNIADRDAPLTATLPITATVTDSRSQTWTGSGSATRTDR